MKKLGRLGLVLGVLSLAGTTTACKNEPPDLALPHRAKGNDHMNKKEWKLAIAEYEKALAIDPKQPKAEKIWRHKTDAHMALGEMDKALEGLQKRLELLEVRAMPQGEKAPTVADFEAEKLADKKAILGAMANIYWTTGRGEQAEQTFNQVLALSPKDESALGWLAEIYAQRGGARSAAAPLVDEHLQKALGYYDQVLELNPNAANTYINKRVVMIKYLENEKMQLKVAELELSENARKKDKAAEAQAKIDASTARIAEFTAKVQELNQKFGEATKAAKAAAAAAAPAAAPTPAPTPAQ